MRAMRRRTGPETRARARAHAEQTMDWSVTFERLLAVYQRVTSSSGQS